METQNATPDTSAGATPMADMTSGTDAKARSGGMGMVILLIVVGAFLGFLKSWMFRGDALSGTSIMDWARMFTGGGDAAARQDMMMWTGGGAALGLVVGMVMMMRRK